MHRTLVDDDHDVEEHIARDIVTLAVKSYIPNDSPATVTEASPERGKFPNAHEEIAASKVNNATAVPERAATVTEEMGIGESATPATQRRTVLVVQVPVLHDA